MLTSELEHLIKMINQTSDNIAIGDADAATLISFSHATEVYL
ncbi:MAG: hypothetical protein ACI90U_000014 [Pseudomonadales bacterium]|jgi:hypothetical protein